MTTVRKIAVLVKAFAANPDDLRLILCKYMVGREKQFSPGVL